MCAVLLPPDANPIAVNKHLISQTVVDLPTNIKFGMEVEYCRYLQVKNYKHVDAKT
jgi:hypothetical protein